MKKFLSIVLVLTLCSCSIQKIDGPTVITETQNITKGSDEYTNPLLRADIEKLATEYVYRVYEVDDKYNPEYVDEATSTEDMINSVKKNNVKSDIKADLITKFTFINKSEADVIIVITSDFSSDSIEAGEYYIPVTVNCQKKENNWVVVDSALGSFVPTNEWDIEQNPVSGQYEFIKKE